MRMRLTILLCGLLVLAACSKVNPANYAKLAVGMSKAEVETLLGSPAACSGALGLSSCTWGDEKSYISVQFAADKALVFSADGLH